MMALKLGKFPEKKCLNCSESFEGNFCWNCGQSDKVKRLNIREILEEFFLSPLHIHPHGLLYTFLWLFRDPGVVIRTYVYGARKLLHPAFRYLVLAGTFATIVIAVYHPFEVVGGETEFVNFIDPEFFVWVSAHITFINLVAVPIFAAVSYVMFRPSGYNYAENLTLQAFIASQQLWILVLFFPVFQFAPQWNSSVNSVYTILTLVYNIYVVMDFFRMKTGVGFMLSILAYAYANIINIGMTYFYFKYLSHLITFSLH